MISKGLLWPWRESVRDKVGVCEGRWHVQCFGRVMEPKKSFRSSLAPSHACHSNCSAWLSGCHIPCTSGCALASHVSHGQHTSQSRVCACTWICLHVGVLSSPTVRHRREVSEWRCSGGGNAEPSNLSQPDKPPRDALTFPPDAADVWSLANSHARTWYTFVYVCSTLLFMHAEVRGLSY